MEAAWILAFLTAKEEETVTELVRVGMVPALVEALVDSGGQVSRYLTLAANVVVSKVNSGVSLQRGLVTAHF